MNLICVNTDEPFTVKIVKISITPQNFFFPSVIPPAFLFSLPPATSDLLSLYISVHFLELYVNKIIQGVLSGFFQHNYFETSSHCVLLMVHLKFFLKIQFS